VHSSNGARKQPQKVNVIAAPTSDPVNVAKNLRPQEAPVGIGVEHHDLEVLVDYERGDLLFAPLLFSDSGVRNKGERN